MSEPHPDPQGPPIIYQGVDISSESTFIIDDALTELMRMKPSILLNRAIHVPYLFTHWIAMKRRQLNNPTFVNLESLNGLIPGFSFNIDMFGPLTANIEAQLAAMPVVQIKHFEALSEKLAIWVEQRLLTIWSLALKELARIKLQLRIDVEEISHIKGFDFY